MISKIIHLVWLGPRTEKVDDTIERYQQLNPDYEIKLYTDDSELDERYRHNWNHYSPVPSMKSDLLRFSVLQKYGGWYFDIDCVPFVPLDTIVEELKLDGSTMLLTYKGGFLNGDILSIQPGFAGWQYINDYLSEPRYAINGVEYSYLEYAYSLFLKCFMKHKDRRHLVTIGPHEHFNYTKGVMPFILREDEIRGYNLEDELTTMTKFKRFFSARQRWMNAGKPNRTPKQMAEIFDKFCKNCSHFTGSSCKLCGCLINRDRRYMNKLLWATERCPHDPPFWEALVQVEDDSQ